MMRKVVLYLSIVIVIGVVALLIILSNVGINLSPFFDVNVSVGNSPPIIEFVDFADAGAVLANLGGVRNVLINFTVSDGNGAVNLNNTSARVEIYNTTFGVLRFNNTCSAVGENGNLRNYTCEIGMWYFDPYGQYVVNVTIADNLGERAENSSKIFQYQQTPGFDIYPNGLIWPAISISSINVNSTNDPLYANNTGNVNFTIVNLTAYDLPGNINSSEFIYAGNFSVNVADSCEGDILINSTGKVINLAGLPVGNLSIGVGTAQEELYFCIEAINTGTTSQTYSTANGGTQWNINFQQ